ncbi:MAG TPA: hypothetical protein VLC73_01390 [Burkholderiales bacterium]|nr:hypothetical protein [Burkholderiales bacterium]
MKRKTDSQITAPVLPRDARAEAILEFVFNDEEEALCNEAFVLTHQREMPAVEEFLQEMTELDARSASACWH